MARIVWTPWHDRSELLMVRSQLFPPKGSTDPDMRSKACGKISAWKLRGNLPHAVESTWRLTEAILADGIKAHGLTPFMIQACYATAFCRFVTGLVDSEQSSKHKVSMYIKARQIGIPASFVELRHEATHGDLPSLEVLRKAAEKSLEWLWDDYWRYLGVRTGYLDEDEISVFKDGRNKLKSDLRESLRVYLDAASKVKGDSHPETEKACFEIMGICNSERLAIAELITVLLEYDMLIPSFRALGQNMDEVFSSWDSLLKLFATRQELFLALLADEMVIRITSPSVMDIKIDTYRESIAMWLIHICASQEWISIIKRAKLSYSSILSTCLQNPNHWTALIASSIIDTPGCKEAKAIYRERIASLVTQQAEPSHAIIKTISIENLDQLLPSQRAWLNSDEGLQEQARFSRELEESAFSPGVGGWQSWKGTWIPKPLSTF